MFPSFLFNFSLTAFSRFLSGKITTVLSIGMFDAFAFPKVPPAGQKVKTINIIKAEIVLFFNIIPPEISLG
jgi:hypothetical protein